MYGFGDFHIVSTIACGVTHLFATVWGLLYGADSAGLTLRT